MRYRVIEMDNYGRDYPGEEWASPSLTKENAERIADIINSDPGRDPERFFRVVMADYTLQPGFEP